MQGVYTAYQAYNNISIDGTTYTGTTDIVYLRIQSETGTRAVFIGTCIGTTDGTVWSKYVSTNKILIRKVIDGTWTLWTSI